MKLKTIALITGLSIGLSGCQLLTSSVDIVASTIFASDKIDTIQTELGGFSSNQEALKELDSLQADIKSTLITGGDVFAVESYHARTIITYETFKREIKSRWDELTTEQQATLIALDNELISINTIIIAMKNSAGVSDDLFNMLYRATVLMSYYKGF